jgi:GntR family transcriptional regulator, transcriptional repressor for pyruvate dehydrogenase complex
MSSVSPLLQSAGTGTLPDRIYASVVEAILRGDYAGSGKLPTEGELCAAFGVSRPTVREALSRLRSDGIIDSRRGAGSYVIRQPGALSVSTVPIRNFADIEHYYAFRSCIEAGAAAGAAEHHDSAELEQLRAAFDALNAAMRGGDSGADEDVAFHLAIARASHNPFFVTTLETSVAPIRQIMELARHATDKKSEERVDLTQAEHQAIIDAIARRDPARAAEATRAHVLNAKRRIFERTLLP